MEVQFVEAAGVGLPRRVSGTHAAPVELGDAAQVSLVVEGRVAELGDGHWHGEAVIWGADALVHGRRGDDVVTVLEKNSPVLEKNSP